MQKALRRQSRFFPPVYIIPYSVVFITQIRGYCYSRFKDEKLQGERTRSSITENFSIFGFSIR